MFFFPGATSSAEMNRGRSPHRSENRPLCPQYIFDPKYQTTYTIHQCLGKVSQIKNKKKFFKELVINQRTLGFVCLKKIIHCNFLGWFCVRLSCNF